MEEKFLGFFDNFCRENGAYLSPLQRCVSTGSSSRGLAAAANYGRGAGVGRGLAVGEGLRVVVAVAVIRSEA